jgi:hypothetical protein
MKNVIIFLLMLNLNGLIVTAQKLEGSLCPKPLPKKNVVQNPFMASSEAAIHNDSYSTDVSNAVFPLGINSNLSEILETENVIAPMAIFFDDFNNPIMPFAPGIAVRNMDGDTFKTLGTFNSVQHDNGLIYSMQISYSFVDNNGYLICPTTHGHIIAFRITDENGNVLPTFEKVFDVDIGNAAIAALGEDIYNKLLGVIYDYSGNLWFVTGGFRIYPDRSPAGYLGYISRSYLEELMVEGSGNANIPSVGQDIFFHELDKGENAENGISSNAKGVAILTNLNCYFLGTLPGEGGIDIKWSVPYKSDGAKDAPEGSNSTGGGLAWGSGTTPTLTNNLVLFTDNQKTVNLIAVSCETGKVVAQTPVLDKITETVSVENSITVYSADDSRASVVACNWFGAGHPKLSDPEFDPSTQQGNFLYDEKWLAEGNHHIAPGIERIDVLQNSNGYYLATTIWTRTDIRSTAMFKVSTATGYLYGYDQDMETGMWQYIVLDWDTGETLLTVPVSKSPVYNNKAVGLIIDSRGNAIYCPTNTLALTRWTDDFVYLPFSPTTRIAFSETTRSYLTKDEFRQLSSSEAEPASFLMGVKFQGAGDKVMVAFRLNGLDGKLDEYKLYKKEGENLVEQTDFKITAQGGGELNANDPLSPEIIYEIRVDVPNVGGYMETQVMLAKRSDPSGISKIEGADLKIYPNPTKNELRIESGSLTINRVEIVDLSGKVIYQFNGLRSQINVSALSHGIYIVKIETNKGTVTKKFVKK